MDSCVPSPESYEDITQEIFSKKLMHLADPAVVIGFKWRLAKRLLQGPALSSVEMAETLTRNNWKQ